MIHLPLRPASIRHFAVDRRGVAAIEFALLAPVMILFYFGLVELCQGFMAQKRMAHTAAAMADIVAQTDVVTEDEIQDVFAIGNLTMSPFPSDTLGMRISSVTRGTDDRVTVEWSVGNWSGGTSKGLKPYPEGEVEIPDDLIGPGQTLIIGESEYTYSSYFESVLPEAVVFSQAHYIQPRTVERIGCADCPDLAEPET